MPVTFLENVAKYIFEQHSDNLENSVVVFPGRRAAVFFKKYLSSIPHKTMWAPQMITVAEFFSKLSDIRILDDLKLLFLLYQIFREETKSPESFDEFYHWGGMLLSDFDDTDKYMADAGQLFSNVESLNEISDKFDGLTEEDIEIIRQFWTHFNPQKKTEHKDEFIKIWKVLNNIYTRFRERLINQNEGYEGIVFRDVAENVANITFPWENVFFVGLNALNPCEQKVMKHLQNEGKAEFFWDYDEFYLNQNHEAGFFMRQNIRNFPAPDFQNTFCNISNIRKNINVYSVASNIGQAKSVKHALQDMAISNDANNIDSCIVLGDENLLIPTLFSIPEEIGKVNVTMGYPIKSAGIFHFIKLYIELHQWSKIKNDELVFYHQQVNAIIQHPYLSFWDEQAEEIKNQIIDKNIIYIPEKFLKVNPLFNLIFQHCKDAFDYAGNLMDILQTIFSKMSYYDDEDTVENKLPEKKYIQTTLFDSLPKNHKENVSEKKYYEIQKEFLYQVFLIIKRLVSILKEFNIHVETSTFVKMLLKSLSSGKVNFIGEPLAGMQLMGALETRGIDFRNIIITSMNEGTFPKKTTALSFIPYSLRKAFKLPTYEHQDAIYAYYFYRLMQRAENIALIYNSNSEGVSGGEMSRYIYQLKYNPDININFFNIDFHIKASNPKPIKIENNDYIKSIMKQYESNEGIRTLSPSALNTFKNCSLRFYFRYIAGLKETDMVQEEVEHAIFGSILHSAMKNIYQNFDNQKIEKKDLENILAENETIDLAIRNAFAMEYFREENADHIDISGRNLIIQEIIKKYITKIIELDINTAPFQIISLEERYNTSFPLFNKKKYINLGGIIDRIDFTNGSFRIIDYKTGNKHNQFQSVESLFFPEKPGENDGIAQIFMYSLIFNQSGNPTKLPVLPSLLFLKEIYLNNFTLHIFLSESGSKKKNAIYDFNLIEEEVKTNLTHLLEKLFDEKVLFSQTDDQKYCQTCPFRGICHR